MLFSVKKLQQFLTTLEPACDLDDVWCWQIRRLPGRGFAPNTAKTFHVHGSVRDSIDMLSWENEGGSDIFVCINETDGGGRKAGNIVRVRAVWVDLDGAPLLPIFKERLPHIVVQSSPGKYHAYWLAEGVPLQFFTPLQQALIRKYDADPSVKDLSRVMRVPGSWHCKDPAHPFKVRMEHIDLTFKGAPYTWEQLKDWLHPQSPTTYVPRPPPVQLPPRVADVLPTLVMYDYHIKDETFGKHSIVCPWAHEHTEGGRVAAMYYEPSPENQWEGGFHCFHAHCADRKISALQTFAEWLRERGGRHG